jgi:hypothetical protein
MTTLSITCPNCNHHFEPADGMRDEIEKELRNKMIDWQKKKDEEFKQKENQFLQQLTTKETEHAKQLQQEKTQLQQQLQESLRKTISQDFENKIKQLQDADAEKEEKLKASRKKELEFLTKERELKNKEEELELLVQKKVSEERKVLGDEIRKIEEQRIAQMQEEFNLKLAEKEKQLDDQRKLAQQMKQKAEQGSMQLQGEIQELLLEDLLKSTFPFDTITEVGKGVKGADCIQTIHTKTGTEAGKIIYESKRTKDFGGDWIEKLKTDMRNLGADIAIIVTQTLPKDMERFGEKEGVYICTFSEVKSVAALLRSALLRIFEIKKSQHNQGDKMVMLYEYLVGSEFGEQWKAIREGFMSMKLSIQKERDMMERLWKAREKQLEKVLLNATHIRGSIEGIAGLDSINLNMIDEEETLLLD